MKLLFGSILILITSLTYYELYIVDPHIDPIIKISHYTWRIVIKWFRLETDKIDRNLVNFFTISPNYTKGKFENGVMISNSKVQSLFDGHLIPIDIYLPENQQKARLPLIIYLHGGGWVLPGLPFGEDYAKKGYIVVFVNYRLSPEFKFPIPLEDCYSVLIWTVKRANFVDLDMDRIYLIGDSAGGNLVTGVSLLNRDRNTGIKISKQVLLYPAVVTKNIGASKITWEDKGYILSGKLMRWFEKQYMRGEEDCDNPYLSALAAESYGNLPTTLFLLATDDYLYSEGLELKEKMEKSGQVKVFTKEYNTAHGFMLSPNLANKAMIDICEFLEKDL